MKRWLMILFVVLSGLSSSMLAADTEGQDQGVTAELRILIKEIRDLRERIEHLEKRMDVIERVPKLLGGPPAVKRGPFEVVPTEEKRDLGLYVFPGLDAPPLSPPHIKPD